MRSLWRRRLPAVVICFQVAALAACGSGEPAAVAAGADVLLAPELELVADVVPRNTTLEALLTDHGLAAETVHQLIAAARTVFDPRRLRAAQPFEIERTLAGAL